MIAWVVVIVRRNVGIGVVARSDTLTLEKGKELLMLGVVVVLLSMMGKVVKWGTHEWTLREQAHA